MKKLIAKRPVLYLGRMYDKGDTLPANDQKMVTAWLNAKSAAWDGQEAEESRQEAREGAEQADGSQDSQNRNGGQEAQENGQEGKMVEGHLDAEQLATMKKAELEKLADQLGVDISSAKNNKERAELIAAVPVQAPANETGGAPSFKDLVAADISAVFLNGQEFADTHTIDGKPMTVVVDENELLERDKSKMGIQVDGTYKARRLIYVAKEEYGPRPAHGKQLNFDGRLFRVADCTEEAGMLAITLEAVRS